VFIVSVLPATIQALFILGVPVLPKMGMRPGHASCSASFIASRYLTPYVIRESRQVQLVRQTNGFRLVSANEPRAQHPLTKGASISESIRMVLETTLFGHVGKNSCRDAANI
jgi:hypothetical protein